MGRGRTPVLPRGMPGGKLWGGDHHLQSGGKGARGPRNPRREPRPPRERGRARPRLLCRRRKGPPKRPWRWRSKGWTTLFSPFFSFSVVFVCLSLSFVRRFMGGRSTEVPHYNRASWFGVGKCFLIKARRCTARGSGYAAAMALRGRM